MQISHIYLSIARKSNDPKPCTYYPFKMHDMESSRSPAAEDETLRLPMVIYPIHSTHHKSIIHTQNHPRTPLLKTPALPNNNEPYSFRRLPHYPALFSLLFTLEPLISPYIPRAICDQCITYRLPTLNHQSIQLEKLADGRLSLQ